MLTIFRACEIAGFDSERVAQVASEMKKFGIC